MPMWEIQGLEYTTDVSPGGRISVSFTVDSTETFHNPLNPNWCFLRDGTDTAVGTLGRAEIVFEDTIMNQQTECIPSTDTWPNPEFTLSFLVPSSVDAPREITPTIVLRKAQSDDRVVSQELSVTISADAMDPRECPAGFEWDPDKNSCVPTSGSGGGGGSGGGDGDGDSGPVDTILNNIDKILVAVLLIALLNSIGDITGDS